MPTPVSTHIPASQARRPALRLVSTRDMPRETWLDVRRQGIGSSDAAAAVGLNPYQSQLELWMHKTGKGHLLPVVDPNEETSPMYWGTLLEPIVAAHYTKRTGNKVRRVNAVLGHPQASTVPSSGEMAFRNTSSCRSCTNWLLQASRPPMWPS
jgi:predicted phage-related endonuclease